MKRAVFWTIAAASFAVVGCIDINHPTDSEKMLRVTITTVPHSFSGNAGAIGTSPALPGSSNSATFSATQGTRLSFAAMFGQSNDWFYAAAPEGIDLYENGQPLTGDITEKVGLWDAGTEADQETGKGSDQAPRQSSPNTGAADPDRRVRKVMLSSGTFGTGPTLPGSSVSFEFDASVGSKLAFAMMYGQSNDWFYGTAPAGIDLYKDDGGMLEGDVTGMVGLYDAGTEADEPIGSGPNQAPRQSAPDTGPADSNTMIRMVTDTAAGDNIRVSLAAGSEKAFRLAIDVLPGSKTPVSPGAWIVTSGGEPIFTEDMPDRGYGLERIAEDGNNGPLSEKLAEYVAQTKDNIAVSLAHDNGVFTLTITTKDNSVTPIAPGLWILDEGGTPIFEEGMPDRGKGLEHLAEDGDASSLMAALETGAMSTPLSPGVWALSKKVMVYFTENEKDYGKGLEHLAEDGNPAPLHDSLMSEGIETGTFGSAPAKIGDSFTFTVSAHRGDRLYFATMFGQSNDLFYSPGEDGLALWEGDEPVTGDVTSRIRLWDAGTEVNEIPGAGMYQAPRQSAPNTGPDEMGVVHIVNDGFVYPQAIKVTIDEVMN